MRTLYVGDLHLGNIYSDVFSFLNLFYDASKTGVFSEVVFLGDFLDGIDMYDTQKYKQMPETIDVQKRLLRWLIEFIYENNIAREIVFVLGNHERTFKGVFVETDGLEKEYYYVSFVNEYVDANNMLCIHQLSKSMRVGSTSGWTPSLVDRAKSVIIDKAENGERINGVIVGHVHKIFDMLINSNKLFILMPSFLSDHRGFDYVLYTNVLLEISDGNIRVYRERGHDVGEITRFNMLFYSKVYVDYRRMLDWNEISEVMLEVIKE